MCSRALIDERAAYTKRAQDYTELIKKFTNPELTEVGNYKIVKELGAGAFGKVYLGYHKFLKMKIVLKKGERSTEKGCNDNLMREYYYLREFNKHPYITKIYEIIFTETSVYMVLEYYPEGDMFEYLSKKKKIPVEEALQMFTQLLGSVSYIHRNGCCHRDLKLENILLDKKLNIKLSDFGFTRELPFAQYGAKSMLSEVCGTAAYMAPELLKEEPYSGVKTDIWSLGVILYTMIAGEMPFDDSKEEADLIEGITNREPDYNELIFKSDLLKLIKSMLSKNPEDRPNSLETVLRMPIIQQYGGSKQININNKLINDGSYPSTEFSSSERSLLKELVAVGFDKDSLKRSIASNHLDSTVGFWELLKEKHKKKSQRKKIKYRSRSMLRISTSRSFMENAKQTFSPSSSLTSTNQNHFLARSENAPEVTTSQTFHNSQSDPLNEDPLSAQTLDTALPMDQPSQPDQPSTIGTHYDKMESLDQRIESSRKSSATTTTTRKPTFEIPSRFDENQSVASVSTKKKHRFSFKSIFGKIKKQKDGDNKPLISSSNSIYDNETLHRKSLQTNGKLDRSSPKRGESPNKSNEVSTTNILVIEPDVVGNRKTSAHSDSASLKRNKPTRPGSMISSYSIQTTMSETSNGSGYITGYSTDNQVAQANGHFSPPSTPSNTNGRPSYNRGISDWSINSKNVTSQPESPNSSFTTLSRSNSLESSSRSLRGRRRKKSSNNGSAFYGSSGGFILKRGKSPLHSKLNTKWNFNNGDGSKASKKFNKDNKQPRQQQIIEEEMEEEENGEGQLVDNDHDELLNETSYADVEMDEEELEELEGQRVGDADDAAVEVDTADDYDDEDDEGEDERDVAADIGDLVSEDSRIDGVDGLRRKLTSFTIGDTVLTLT